MYYIHSYFGLNFCKRELLYNSGSSEPSVRAHKTFETLSQILCRMKWIQLYLHYATLLYLRVKEREGVLVNVLESRFFPYGSYVL